jgi:hypothetical protein
MADLKTHPTSASVDAFVERSEPVGRREDARVLLDIMKRVTGVDPVMWGPSIIGFGSYHYRYASGHEGDVPVIGFSPRKAAMSVYGLHFYSDESLLDGLGPYKAGKGCLFLGRFDRLNLEVLEKACRTAWNGGVPFFLDAALGSHHKEPSDSL